VSELGNSLRALPEDTACPAHPVADFLGERALTAGRTNLQKAEFYTTSMPAIEEVAALTLVGEGLETRFAPGMFALEYSHETARQTPFNVFMLGTIYGMEDFVAENASERYQGFASAAMQHKYHQFLYTSAIARGCHPREIRDFGLLTIPLLQTHPLLQDKAPEQRIHMAHELSDILLRRAMANVANIALRPELTTMIGKVDIKAHRGKHQLIDAETHRPLPIGNNLAQPVGPTLRCPALPYLPAFIAAGVNLIADAGYYHPGVPPRNFRPAPVPPQC
jgi:hypothetical protein